MTRTYATEDGIAQYTVFSIDPNDTGTIVEGPDPTSHVLGEMIWAMEATLDWQNRMSRHIIKYADFDSTPTPGKPGSYDINVRRPGVIDKEGLRSDGERLRKGHRLFARYIRAL